MKMALVEKAKQVAAEFEYPPDELNRGVQEFLEEMGMCPSTNAGPTVKASGSLQSLD